MSLDEQRTKVPYMPDHLCTNIWGWMLMGILPWPCNCKSFAWGGKMAHHRGREGIEDCLGQRMPPRLRTDAEQVCAPLAVVDHSLETCKPFRCP